MALTLPVATDVQSAAVSRSVTDILERGLDSLLHAGLAVQVGQQSCSVLTVIPEHGTIDVASTPSIPEEEAWAPPLSASGSLRLGSSPSAATKDWTAIETKLECFARDLDVSR
mmetsp:Transcript_18878/g.52660  ORF Transcript_18878/g.52660 Transcript_18878/m.52660 type:complete len:113 (-) Transcript_18878:328-666(-)|eukprot:CAMPEP_0117664070 /NCGR_PEP_ID=MMETSP0804-20121206/8993_1 /TAXON_ID=1074897 /ORGANISM="Tetraselmis astigmatica, Strain CCMP880" /LENGTH=112 /DNA_ID=CAMNT_0005471217 /DNA_START=374 /DNA_END=712 /DNA_ORIENTATION=-